MEPRNRFQGMNSASLCSLAGRYDNPIPTRFLVPIDCLKFQLWSSLCSLAGRVSSTPLIKYMYSLDLYIIEVTLNTCNIPKASQSAEQYFYLKYLKKLWNVLSKVKKGGFGVCKRGLENGLHTPIADFFIKQANRKKDSQINLPQIFRG
jgi:hypothetical protein